MNAHPDQLCTDAQLVGNLLDEEALPSSASAADEVTAGIANLPEHLADFPEPCVHVAFGDANGSELVAQAAERQAIVGRTGQHLQ